MQKGCAATDTAPRRDMRAKARTFLVLLARTDPVPILVSAAHAWLGGAARGPWGEPRVKGPWRQPGRAVRAAWLISAVRLGSRSPPVRGR